MSCWGKKKKSLKLQNDAATDGKGEMCPTLQLTEALNWPKLISEVVFAHGKGTIRS